jgi:activating signal cointegrator 1
MKAITICEPYASLICLPDDDDRAKRVENRTWPTNYRGPLLIHAGKSRKWLASGAEYGIPESSLVFGAIVGAAMLADCLTVQEASVSTRWPWLKFHDHASGPFCFVLTRCQRLAAPIPYRGAQGFFDVPKEIIEASGLVFE